MPITPISSINALFRVFLGTLALLFLWPGFGSVGISAGVSGRAMAQKAPARPLVRPLVLAASPALIDSGFLGFLLPRFSLKTGIDIDVQPIDSKYTNPPEIPPGASLSLIEIGTDTTGGTVVITERSDDAQPRKFALFLAPAAPAGAQDFLRWLKSEIGRRTIGQFRRDGRQVFAPPDKASAAAAAIVFSGDVGRGRKLSYLNCGRCHVIGPRNRMAGIGSTPSFSALRALGDWRARFLSFYSRNPHPAVVEVENLSPQRSEAHTTPMSPVVITRDEFNDILAFVASIKPANLGAPIAHQ